MKEKGCFMKMVHACTGGGGWHCQCCCPPKKSRKRVMRSYKKKFNRMVDKFHKE